MKSSTRSAGATSGSRLIFTLIVSNIALRCMLGGKESKRVTLIEKKVIGDYDDESITQTFAGTAHYDENFNPVDTDTSHCSDLLALQSIAKVGQAS